MITISFDVPFGKLDVCCASQLGVWFASQLGVWFASQLGVWFASPLGGWFARQLGVFRVDVLTSHAKKKSACRLPEQKNWRADPPKKNIVRTSRFSEFFPGF